MSEKKIIFKENSLSLDDYIRLKKEAFGDVFSKSSYVSSLKGSKYVLHAEIGGEVVGMAIIIDDGGYTIFITDVIVAPKYQGKGIGRQIMEHILQYLKSSAQQREKIEISLFAAESEKGFYEKFGFASSPDEEFGVGVQLWLKE